MLPDLFGFIHMYGLMIAIGVLVAFTVLYAYGRRVGASEKLLDFAFYDLIVSIVVGFGFAALFQAVYDFIKYPENGFRFNGGLTFLGGLIGGSLCFFAGCAIFRKKLPEGFSSLMKVLPCCITVAHGFGRIGCFFAGCCYGKPTDSWLGVQFPNMAVRVHPTQLYEAFFLFVLFAALSVLLYKNKGRFNFPVYFIAYGIFRFFIEFIRDDERGALVAGITPSQFWSIVLIVVGIAVIVSAKIKDKKRKAPAEQAEETGAEEQEEQAETGEAAETVEQAKTEETAETVEQAETEEAAETVEQTETAEQDGQTETAGQTE